MSQNPSKTYRTLENSAGPVLLKERKSKFLGYAFPVQSQEEIKIHLEGLREEHDAANHVCYAWQLGTASPQFRANDDGEPNHSAGTPIHGQIRSFEITNVLVAVVRYFGGTKLGVGGLKQAYRDSAKAVLETANIISLIETKKMMVVFQYAQMNLVMRVIKQLQLKIITQTMEAQCSLQLEIEKSRWDDAHTAFQKIYGIHIKVD
ncbi:MAG: YigZ family protein [Bacteroidota bacterium]